LKKEADIENQFFFVRKIDSIKKRGINHTDEKEPPLEKILSEYQKRKKGGI